MKRALVLALVLAISLGFAAAQPAGIPAGVFSLASVAPADAAVFIGLRIDDQSIATIDALIAKIAGVAAEFGAPVGEIPTVRSALATGRVTPEMVDRFLAGAGDTMAVVVTGPSGSTFIGVEVVDRAAIESVLTSAGLSAGEARGGFTSFAINRQTVLLSDDLLIASSESSDDALNRIASGDYPRLGSDGAFSEAIGSLPAADYGLGVYALPAAIGGATMPVGLPYEAIAVGAGIMDGSTLLLDMVLQGDFPQAFAVTVDPDFRRFIPADSSAFAHSAGLSAIVEEMIGAMSAGAGSGMDARAEVVRAFSSVGLDFDELMAWTDGDYAIFGRLDLMALIERFNAQNIDPSKLSDTFDFGAVIATDNPDASARLVSTLTSLIRAAGSRADGVSISEETIAGFPATVVTVAGEAAGGMTLRFALASSSEAFAIGTYNCVAAALSASPGMAGSALAVEASRYWLPDASSVAFIDGATLSQGVTLMGLVLLGPVIGNVFSDIVGALETGATPVPTPTPVPFNPFGSPEALTAFFERVNRLVRFATVSSRVTTGSSVLRVTLTLGE